MRKTGRSKSGFERNGEVWRNSLLKKLKYKKTRRSKREFKKSLDRLREVYIKMRDLRRTGRK